MVIDTNKLEDILNKEIEIYTELEKWTFDKKQSLVNCDIKNLKRIDKEIKKYTAKAQILEKEKFKLTNSNLLLKDVIEKIEDKEKVARLSNLSEKLKSTAGNIQKENKVNEQLIKHGLKMLEFTVLSITKVLAPEVSAYNYRGKTNKNNTSVKISSISREA